MPNCDRTEPPGLERQAADLERHAADIERHAAEQRLLGLAPNLSSAEVAALSDHGLRLALVQSELARARAQRRRAAGDPTVRRERVAGVVQREVILLEMIRRAWPDAGGEPAGLGEADGPALDELAQQLAEQFDIEVADDGLVECGRLTAEARRVIGPAAVAMFHHTSTALREAILERGLIIGTQTNFFNTQAGVYLSTLRAGSPVDVYSRRAARVHGGDPMTVRVRRTLDQLQDDPDDADLAWAFGRQFVTPSVPPEDLWDQDLYSSDDADDRDVVGRPRDGAA